MLKDKKINIWGKTYILDDLKQQIEKPLLVASNIWAYYRHAKASEYFSVAGDVNKVEAIFVINYREGIDASMEIEYKGNRYNITSIDDFEGNKTDLKIFAYRKK